MVAVRVASWDAQSVVGMAVQKAVLRAGRWALAMVANWAVSWADSSALSSAVMWALWMVDKMAEQSVEP